METLIINKSPYACVLIRQLILINAPKIIAKYIQFTTNHPSLNITLIIIKAILVLPAKMKLWPQGKLVNDWVLRSQNHCAWVCCRWPCYRAWSLLSPSWAGSGEPGDKDDKKAINQTKPKVPILYLQSTDLYKKKLQITLFLFSSEEITGIQN